MSQIRGCAALVCLAVFLPTGFAAAGGVTTVRADSERRQFQANSRSAFSGLALLIVAGKPGETGQVRIETTADGLAAGSARLTTVR
jgi:hypothetical protein